MAPLTRTLTVEQRNLLGEWCELKLEVRDIGVGLGRLGLLAHAQLVADLVRLLDDLGWDADAECDTYALTMPDDQLLRLAELFRTTAAEMLHDELNPPDWMSAARALDGGVFGWEQVDRDLELLHLARAMGGS